MAVTASQAVAVSSTAVSLNTPGRSGQTLILKNGATGELSLGPSGVTASTGFRLAVSTTLTVELPPGTELFAIRATVDATVDVLRMFL